MGIIIKQSIKSTIYAYIGAVVGFVNVGLLMPKLLSTEEIGLINIIISYVLVISQFSGLGFDNVISRLFPYFRNKPQNHHGFFTIGLGVSLIGSILSVVIYFLMKDNLISGKSEILVLSEYIIYVIPLSIITIFLNYFDFFFRALFNAAIGVFLKDVVTRVLITLFIVLYSLGIIDFSEFVFFYYLAYSLPVFILGILLIQKGEFKIQKPRRFLIKKLKYLMVSVAGFGLISGFNNIAILQIDRLMLKSFEGLSDVGVYTTSFAFASLIIYPFRSIRKISTIVIAESWKNNDLNNIKTIYEKSTITLLIIGSYIFMGIWGNIDNIIDVLGPSYSEGRYVILFIGLTNMLYLSNGVNFEIIGTSKKYIYISLFTFTLLVLLIATNLIFIPIYGLTGAAIASFISTFIFISIRFIFVWTIFGLQPYNYKHLIILSIVIAVGFLTSIIPEINNPYFDIIAKGLFISVIFWLLIYISKTSSDINTKINQIASKFINKK